MIKGEKVGLREVRNEDLVLMNKWNNDPDFILLHNAFYYLPITLEDTQRWHESIKNNPSRQLITIVDQKEDVIGYMTLWCIDWRNKNCRLALGFGSKEYSGSGYGIDARRTILKYLFQHWNFHRVFAYITSYHDSGISFTKKMNASFSGYMKKVAYVNGEYHDFHVVQFDREKFLGLEK